MADNERKKHAFSYHREVTFCSVFLLVGRISSTANQNPNNSELTNILTASVPGKDFTVKQIP
jgi:hypothetical protein